MSDLADLLTCRAPSPVRTSPLTPSFFPAGSPHPLAAYLRAPQRRNVAVKKRVTDSASAVTFQNDASRSDRAICRGVLRSANHPEQGTDVPVHSGATTCTQRAHGTM